MTASPVALSGVAFNPETRLYIDGQLQMSSTGRTVDNLNPATEEGPRNQDHRIPDRLKAVFQQRNS